MLKSITKIVKVSYTDLCSNTNYNNTRKKCFKTVKNDEIYSEIN